MNKETRSQAGPVPEYAGHADASARRLSDRQVRAWVGEVLTGLAERLSLDSQRDRIDALLMRCEFADQHLIHALEDDRFAGNDAAAAVEGYDRELVSAANACSESGAEELPARLEALERAFNERAAGIEARLKR